MIDDKNDYVPADIVKMIFEQTQKSVESNTAAIKEMTGAINELTTIISMPPTNRDIIQDIKEHDGKSDQRKKELCDIKEKQEGISKVEVEKHYKEQNETLDRIDDNVKKLKSKIITMITVIVIAFGLMTIAYMFVNNSVETIVKNNIKAVIEDTIKKNNINNSVRPQGGQNEIK